MSAKNWNKCPKCEMRATGKLAEMQKSAADAYGKVDLNKYIEMLREADSPIKIGETLREDYELGIDGTAFMVSYRASCDKCGFEFKYKTSVAIQELNK